MPLSVDSASSSPDASLLADASGRILLDEDLSELLRGVVTLKAGWTSRFSSADSSLGGERAPSWPEAGRMLEAFRTEVGRVFLTERASLVLSICLKDTAPVRQH